MQAVFLVTLPFFALVLAGFWGAWRGILPLNAIAGLNAYVLFFALPCMLFRFGSSTPIATLLDPVTMAVYAACALVIVGFTLLLTLGGRVGWSDASLGALVAAFPNTGFMGVPLLVALFGPRAAGVLMQTMMIDMLLTTSLCVALSRWGQSQDASVGRSLLNALKGVFSNPMPWAILAGMLASGLQATETGQSLQQLASLGQPLYKALSLLADSASPVALFTIGAVLARAQRQAQEQQKKALQHAPSTQGSGPSARGAALSPWADAMVVALIKLFLHPFLILLAALAARALGFALDPFALLVLLAAAALPSASNVSLLAERYGADNGRIARIILLSTVIAFFTFSSLVAVLK